MIVLWNIWSFFTHHWLLDRFAYNALPSHQISIPPMCFPWPSFKLLLKSYFLLRRLPKLITREILSFEPPTTQIQTYKHPFLPRTVQHTSLGHLLLTVKISANTFRPVCLSQLWTAAAQWPFVHGARSCEGEKEEGGSSISPRHLPTQDEELPWRAIRHLPDDLKAILPFSHFQQGKQAWSVIPRNSAWKLSIVETSPDAPGEPVLEWIIHAPGCPGLQRKHVQVLQVLWHYHIHGGFVRTL